MINNNNVEVDAPQVCGTEGNKSSRVLPCGGACETIQKETSLVTLAFTINETLKMAIIGAHHNAGVVLVVTV